MNGGRRVTPAARPPLELRAAYAECLRLAERHYENFTVASRLLPPRLRPHLAAIYAFCRRVDDLGDELAGDRLAALDAWEAELDRCFDGRPETPTFCALQHTVATFALPREPFARLIAANRRDQRQHAYATFTDLLSYCECSANPVGRLVLALYGYRDEERARLSDATCTALQLTNFWQDAGQDARRGRIYVPLEDLARHGCAPDDLLQAHAHPGLRRLFAFQVRRTRALFARGAPLERLVPLRLAVQLRMYRLGGLAVLDALARQGYDPLRRRPVLRPTDKARVAARALWPLQPAPRGEVDTDDARAIL